MPPGTSRRDGIARAATLVLLLCGIALVVRGWLRSDMATKLPWDAGGARNALAFSGMVWLAFSLLCFRRRDALPSAIAIVATVVLAAFAGPVPVAGVAVLFLAACSLGHAILSRAARTPPVSSDLALCTALGLGVLGAVFSVLALWPVNTPFTWYALLALPLVARARPVATLLAEALRRPTADLRWPDLLLAGLLGNLVALHVAVALLPEVGNDALALHLVVAAHVTDFGAWHYDVQRNVAAVSPLLVDFLYAAGYMAGGEVAARLVNVGTLLVVLAVVHAAVRGVASRRVALLATMLAAASPLVALESASLFIDNGWALFVVASLVALLRFAKGAEPVHLVAGGIAFGAALASKAITVAALPAAALLVGLAWHDRRRAFPWRTLAGAVVAGLAVALPPYVIAFAKTGNPVFPLFNAVFRSPLFPPRSGIIYPAEADPALLYRMTFYSDRYLEAYPGALGFTLLLLLPAMIAAAARWGRRDGRTMLFAAIVFAAFVVANTAYLRYLYPSLFLFAIAVGTTLPALDRSDALLGGAFKLTALGGVVVSALFLPAAFAPLRTFDLRAIHDAGAREAFVTAWAPTRQFVPLLNAMPAERGAVAFLGAQPYLAQITRPAYTDVAYQRGFLDAGAALRTEADLLRLIRDFELGFLVVDARRAPRLPALVHGAALPLVRAGDATLYEVTPHARYQVEHVPDDGFDASPGGWVPSGEPARAGAAVVVNGASAVYRPVAVQAGTAYRYAVDARCRDVPADLRLQVLWQMPGGGTKVDARAVPCTPHWSEASDVLVAPPGSSMAVIYATGHAAAPVEIRRVSFRSRR